MVFLLQNAQNDFVPGALSCLRLHSCTCLALSWTALYKIRT